MKKFFCTILFRTTNTVTKKMMHEETFLFVFANSEEQARQKAETYGKANQSVYQNDKGEELRMEFVKVGDTGAFLSDESQEVNEIFIRSFATLDEYLNFVI